MLQERIEKLENELAELKELAKSGIFRVGCYFKYSQYGKNNLMKEGNPEAHKDKVYKLMRFDSRKNCSGEYNLISECNHEVSPMWLELATNEEIEKHLIQEAEKKGFVKGARVIASQSKDLVVYYSTNKSWNKLMLHGETEIIGCRLIDNELLFQVKKSTDYVWYKIQALQLLPSCPQITINGYKAEFKEWGLDFNNGSTKIAKELFIDLAKFNGISTKSDYRESNKHITSVAIGSGTFRVDQIQEIAKYYETK